LPLPETIPVKISSEAAGYVSITPVVVQQMSASDLLENILRVAGKDLSRTQEILRRGSVVSGASRIRFAPLEISLEDLANAFQAFPDPNPNRPFDAAMCVRAALAGGRAAVEISREAASRKGLFSRTSFWQVLIELAARLSPAYHQYSYSDRADVYRCELPVDATRELRDQAGLLKYPSLEQQVRQYAYDRLDLWVPR
jgi:hypothetical protein